MAKNTRRNLLKGLAVSAPAAWTTPFVTSVILPAHAQTSPCGPFLSCATDEPTSDTEAGSFGGSGSAWGWSSGTPTDFYMARIAGLEAQACPGTDVTIDIADETGDGSAGIGVGETTTADGSGVASFTEGVAIVIPGTSNGGGGTPLRFTLRFSSDDGSDSCDIPFCFTEFSPGFCGKPGP